MKKNVNDFNFSLEERLSSDSLKLGKLGLNRTRK